MVSIAAATAGAQAWKRDRLLRGSTMSVRLRGILPRHLFQQIGVGLPVVACLCRRI